MPRLLSLTRLSLWLSTFALASRRSALESPSRYLEMPCFSGKENSSTLTAYSEEGRGLAGRECRHSAMAERLVSKQPTICSSTVDSILVNSFMLFCCHSARYASNLHVSSSFFDRC